MPAKQFKSCIDGSKTWDNHGSVCRTVAKTEESVIDLIAIIEHSETSEASIRSLVKMVNDYKNGKEAFTCTIFLDEKLILLKSGN